MSVTSNRNASIDLFRLLAALMVFVNHSAYSGQAPALALIGRWTVPFFFMVSGYYFQQAYTKLSISAFAKTLKSVLTIYVLANSFYLLFVGVTDGSIKSLTTHFTLVVGTYFHLWFLTSLLLGYGVLWLFLVCNNEKYIPHLTGLVILLILCLNPYSSLIGLPAHPVYARSLLSIPFLCIGFMIAKYTLEINVSLRMACQMVAVGIGIQLVEAWLLTKSWQYTLNFNFVVGTLIFSVGMFFVALQSRIPENNVLSHYGRRYSMAFYLYHPAVNYLLSKAWSKPGTISYWLNPFLSLLILFCLFLFLDRISPRCFRLLTGNFRRYALVEKV
ncbi:acyltransferase [Spirosoma sp. RP8]|uniref:Acyltransferase n=1 Tax=Spirosoma liriopis TaxID=2937440 RepID=A0ABT0HRX5_9BACT|nr:acyltransferase [Spirosoma liriopis]